MKQSIPSVSRSQLLQWAQELAKANLLLIKASTTVGGIVWEIIGPDDLPAPRAEPEPTPNVIPFPHGR